MGKHLVFTLKRGLSFCRRTFEGLTVQRSVEKGFNFISPFSKDCSPKLAPIIRFLSFYLDEIGKNISKGINGENNAVFQE